jgi:hypothetical protein
LSKKALILQTTAAPQRQNESKIDAEKKPDAAKKVASCPRKVEPVTSGRDRLEKMPLMRSVNA